MRPPDALRRRTHLSGRLSSHRHDRHDTDRTILSCLAGGVSCARLSAAADGPARRAAPARRVEHAQCDKLLTVVGRIKSTICEIFPSPEFGQSSGGNYLYFRSYLNNHSVLVERSVYAKISWICSTVLTQYRLVRETPMRNYYRASIESRRFLPAVIAHAVTE